MLMKLQNRKQLKQKHCRIIAGRNATACGYDPQFPGISLLLTDGLSTSPCSSIFLLRYYFGMSASVW